MCLGRNRRWLPLKGKLYSLACHVKCKVKSFGKYTSGRERFDEESRRIQCSLMCLAALSLGCCGALWIMNTIDDFLSQRDNVPKRHSTINCRTIFGR